jgi:hypothetical protein
VAALTDRIAALEAEDAKLKWSPSGPPTHNRLVE